MDGQTLIAPGCWRGRIPRDHCSMLPTMSEKVILVDETDREVGTEGKLEAHAEGRLHRAFSVFVVNSRGDMLLQRRAATKYHSGGLWTNTCCSHPRPGEPLEKAAHRRLREEMGFDCELRETFSFIYRVEVDKELYEHEYDHVFIGRFDGAPVPDPGEADGWKWMDVEELQADLLCNPGRYTRWLEICLRDTIGSFPKYLIIPRATSSEKKGALS